MTSDPHPCVIGRLPQVLVKKFILGLILLSSWTTSSFGQTCSCAGAPLISAQSVGASKAGHLVIGLTYEHHEISRVFAGTKRVGEETERSTRSTLLEIHYGVTDRFSISTTINFAQKDRTTGTDGSNARSSLSTNGIGDGLFLVRYTLLKQSLFKRNLLVIGIGAKAPFGSSSLSRDGIALNSDMQPGTGAWDGVVLIYWSRSMLPRSTASLFATANYRVSGTNKRFNAADRYRFGNDLSFSFGAGNSIGTRSSYSLALLFRTTTQDQRNKAEIFNTGGRWLSVAPSLQYSLSSQTDVRISGRYPIAQWLRGTQPSTSFAAAISFFYNFGQTKNGFTKRSTL